MKFVFRSLLVVAFFALVHYGNGAIIEPILTTSQGVIKGKISESRNGRNFVEYLGIPYVKRPERFQESGAASKWEGTRDGTKFGPPCPQFDRKSKMVIGNEDCLFLNVYTPQIPKQDSLSPPPSPSGTKTGASSTTAASVLPAKKRPVIVYIHGGSFVGQSGDLFGPNYLLDEDVILVTFNYRLSVLGFLSTGDKESIANLGLRDQIQALKWVQQNIQAFGGDPTRVTLFGGGSAGGAMASYLTLSPLSKGLFSGVISTSANALCPWAIVRNPSKIAAKLATKLNCPNTKTSSGIIACLKGKGIKDIEIARVSLQGFAEDPAVPFAPVVESWLAKDLLGKPVIPDQPEKLMREGKFTQVPWLTGVNSLNGVNLGLANVLTTPKRLAQLDTEWTKLAPITFHFSQTAENPSNISDQIREHYFGTQKINEATRDNLISALTDRNFVHCTAQAASLQSKFIPVYLYSLEYLGASSFLDDWGLREKLNLKGVVHGDELQHIFHLKLGNFPFLKKGDKHHPFSEKMVKLIATFSQNGKPMEVAEKAGAEWSPVVSNQPKSKLEWYKLDSVALSLPIRFDESRMSKLWDNLDLGESSSNDGQKFAIGYELPPLTKSAPKPSPITPTQGNKLIDANTKTPGAGSVNPLLSSHSSLQSKVPVGGTPSPSPSSGLPSYGLTPLKALAFPSTAKPLVTPAASVVHVTPPGTAKPLVTPAASVVHVTPPGTAKPLVTPAASVIQVTPPGTAKPLVTPAQEKKDFSPAPALLSVKGQVTPQTGSTTKPLMTSATPIQSDGTTAKSIFGTAANKNVDKSEPVLLSVVFKDDDPYSSTSTTTTTKKPGFFSKLLG